jgi:putative SOS response-associated peptidase YedK
LKFGKRRSGRSWSTKTHSAYDAWLDPTNQDTEKLREFLRPLPADRMRSYPVSTWVNNPRHDDPRCVEPAA